MVDIITCLNDSMPKIIKYTKVIDFPMYGCKVSIIITDNLKQVVNNIYKKYKMTEVFENDAEGVVITPNIDNYHLIIDTKYLSHNTIAHEVYHATVRVTEDRDIVDEETQAWVAGHIASVMYKFLDKKNLTIKYGS